VQISLDVRNENLSEKRIHQICAWKTSPLRGGRNFGRSGRQLAPRGPSLRRGSPSPRILTVISLLFFFSRWRRQPNSAIPARDPRLQKEAKALQTRREVDWTATPSRAADKKSSTGCGECGCFPLLFTMRVVADRACNYSPRLSARDAGGGAHQCQHILSPSFQFAERQRSAMTRYIPYRTERALAFLRLR
jgi:hypothetical protein